jgi:polysaccharide biosynthesis protein VpsQ
MRIRRAKIVLVAFVAFLVALVALADSGHGQQLFQLARKVPAGDKLGHFVLFGTLSFLVNLVLRAPEIRLGRITFLKGSAIVGTIVTAEEFSQLFFRSRSFDLGDLTADLLGIWLGGWLARKYLAWKRAATIPAAKSL